MRLGFGEILIILIILVPSIVIPWKIVSKAGYNGAWSLMLLVPLVGVVMTFVFAFSEWPVLRELRAAREKFGAPLPPEAFKRG